MTLKVAWKKSDQLQTTGPKEQHRSVWPSGFSLTGFLRRWQSRKRETLENNHSIPAKHFRKTVDSYLSKGQMGEPRTSILPMLL